MYKSAVWALEAKVVERVQIDPGAISEAAFLSITSAISTRVLQR